jgi:hypothetical protein
MSKLDRQQNSSFPRFDRVIRNQRWLATTNGFVTVAILIGTFGAVASLFG